MKRREAFKKLGLLSMAGLSGMVLVSCGTEDKKAAKVPATAATAIPEAKSEREKLISNRERMSMADPANPTKAELKHTPDISLGEKDEQGNTPVIVSVGMEGIIHPYTKEHWIDFIKVYVNERLLVDSEIANGGVRPYGQYYLKLNPGDKIRVESGCNKHGIWENSIKV
jgi:desulfoferrodoxin (superoxide reductase-like protein)